MKKSVLILLLCAFLVGCDTAVTQLPTQEAAQQASTQQSQAEPAATVSLDREELFSDRDLSGRWEAGGAVQVRLQGTQAQFDGAGVTAEAGRVTLSREGVYVLTGSLQGMVVVDAPEDAKVQLVLQGADIQSQSSAAIYVACADKVFLTLEGENTLQNGGSFVAIDDQNIDAAVYSRTDLTVNGMGALAVLSPAGHGIVSKDELTLAEGNVTVECAGHGLCGKDSVAIAGGSWQLQTGKDGIHAENADDATLGNVYIGAGSFVIEAAGDGISAADSMLIENGEFILTTGGGAVNAQQKTSQGWGGMGGRPGRPGGNGGPGDPWGGMEESDTQEDATSIKGLKAGTMTLRDGSYTLDCADDAVHSNGALTVTGGSFQIKTGDDGFHADGALTVSGGSITVSQSYEGLEGLSVTVAGSEISLVATDDGLNAAGGTDGSGFGGHRGGDRFGGGGSSSSFVAISGGRLYVQAGGDGIDSNGSLTISGGHTTVCGPTRGDTAVLDYDSTGVITGGTFIGTGAYGMAQSITGSGQGVLALSVGNQSAGTAVSLADSTGTQLISHTPALDYAIVIFSCPQMVQGQTYTVSVGSLSEGFAAN